MKKSFFSLIQQQYIFTRIEIFLAILAMTTPFKEFIVHPALYVGGLLVWASILEIFHGNKSRNVTK